MFLTHTNYKCCGLLKRRLLKWLQHPYMQYRAWLIGLPDPHLRSSTRNGMLVFRCIQDLRQTYNNIIISSNHISGNNDDNNHNSSNNSPCSEQLCAFLTPGHPGEAQQARRDPGRRKRATRVNLHCSWRGDRPRVWNWCKRLGPSHPSAESTWTYTAKTGRQASSGVRLHVIASASHPFALRICHSHACAGFDHGTPRIRLRITPNMLHTCLISLPPLSANSIGLEMPSIAVPSKVAWLRTMGSTLLGSLQK